jgi:hypothetical protein
MILDRTASLPVAELRLLDLNRVVEYLLAQNWKERAGAGRGVARIFYRQENRLMEVSIPTDKTVRDYDNLVARSVAVIAEFENNRPQMEVYDDIIFFADDVIELAELGADAANGTISFERGEELFYGARQSLQSLAHLEMKPQAFHPRMHRKESDLLLSRCRLCQTKKGSYIISIACPLNAVPMQPLFADTSVGFTRSVTTRLVDSVKVLVECAESNNVQAAVRADDTRKLSANLCDGLLQLAPVYPGGQLSIGVRWAKSQPVGEFEVPRPVVLKHEHKPFIEEVRAQLQPTIENPETPQEFYGRIVSLAGEFDDENHRRGLVFFSVNDADGRRYKVKVNLSPQDHKAAHEVYLEPNVAIIFRGVLMGSGGTRTIEHYTDFQIRRVS